MSISIVAAISSNSGLGVDDKLLFKIKEDLQHFQKLTKGQIVILGRKTFESIVDMNGRALPNRTNVILTRDENYEAKFGEIAFNSVDKIINHHKTMGDSDKKIMVCGGEEVYKIMLKHSDTVYITHINKHVEEANIFFPIEELNELFYIYEQSEEYYSEEYDAYYKFVTYRKHTVEDSNKEGDENG